MAQQISNDRFVGQQNVTARPPMEMGMAIAVEKYRDMGTGKSTSCCRLASQRAHRHTPHTHTHTPPVSACVFASDAAGFDRVLRVRACYDMRARRHPGEDCTEGDIGNEAQ